MKTSLICVLLQEGLGANEAGQYLATCRAGEMPDDIATILVVEQMIGSSLGKDIQDCLNFWEFFFQLEELLLSDAMRSIQPTRNAPTSSCPM